MLDYIRLQPLSWRLCLKLPLVSRHLRLGLPAFGRSLLTLDAEHPIGQLHHLLQVRVQSGHVEQNGRLPGGLLEGLGQVAHHLPGILVKEGVVLHDQEAVVVLLQDGHELEEGVGAAHFQLSDVAVQPIEDAGVVATDEEDLVALQFQVASLGFGQHLHGGDEEAVGLGEQGDGGEEFDFHDGEQGARGISRRGKGRGECEGIC
jgi:hypothetical protein